MPHRHQYLAFKISDLSLSDERVVLSALFYFALLVGNKVGYLHCLWMFSYPFVCEQPVEPSYTFFCWGVLCQLTPTTWDAWAWALRATQRREAARMGTGNGSPALPAPWNLGSARRSHPERLPGHSRGQV